jgi:hypothetical protein
LIACQNLTLTLISNLNLKLNLENHHGVGRIHEVASSVLSKNGSAKASNWLDICPQMLKDNENLKHILPLKKSSQLLQEAPVLP